MAPKRASKQQQQLNVDQYTLLKKPMEHLGKQLNVPGSFWQGRMSEDERDKIYKCTIVDFSLAQKVAPTSSPRMAFKVQEMGIDGTGSHEHSDLASTMYWIGYPMPFLRFFYDTFPAVDVASAGAAVVVMWDLRESFPLTSPSSSRLHATWHTRPTSRRSSQERDYSLTLTISSHTCRHLSWLASTRKPSNHSSMPSRTSIMRCSATRVARKPAFRV